MGRRATRGQERLLREVTDGTQSFLETDERQLVACDGRVVDQRGNVSLDRHTLFVVLTDRRLLLFLLVNKAFTWGLAKPPELLVESMREHARASFDPKRGDLRVAFSDGLAVGPTFTMRATAQSTYTRAARIAATLSPLEPTESAD